MRQVDEGRGMPECRQSGACQGFGVVNRRLRAPLARDEAICRCQAGQKRDPGPEPPGIWRMSVWNLKDWYREA